ncbi:MAG: polyphosphate kinase 1 [Bacteroidia bacterium]|nr:polyphosphate kinase 1 [Bacteroidia bacterium]MDW8159069.1 polyphosphate kinase 1 [Bacteroidia bacterium]
MHDNSKVVFFNRELSWLKFNERVLEESENSSNPLLERLKFASIFYSNLDEFFMIRVAGLIEQVEANINESSPDGLSPKEQLFRINQEVQKLYNRFFHNLNHNILPALEKSGIYICKYNELEAQQKEYLRNYFEEKIFPILTPLAIDSSHPIPQLRGLGINLFVEVYRKVKPRKIKVAIVPIPTLLPRFIHFQNQNNHKVILIEELIKAHIELLFPNMHIRKIFLFRITRNADLDISEAEADDLLKQIERGLRKRRLGTIIRLEVEKDISPKATQFLQKAFELEPSDTYQCEGYLAVDTFMQLVETINLPHLKYPPFTPVLHPIVASNEDIFMALKHHDILLHHPYDSFLPVVKFIRDAARDPQVVAIKQTLYRTSGKSQIVMALKEAAANGKEVTALIELKARFDEQANILWAKELEKVGVNVIYGVSGLKTHCKIALVLRQEGESIRTYVHLSTGNYNERTAEIYTDIGILTANQALGKDIIELFNYLTGISGQKNWRKIYVAPINLRQHFEKEIDNCISYHSPLTPSSIRIIMNSLVDPPMITKLYQASQVGIKIKLLVRGICCLVPGIQGLSENIEVRSIVGRFLEHARLYCFEYNNQIRYYSGSADWMQRNLNRRVEVIYQVDDPKLQEQLETIFSIMWRDTVKARVLQPNGNYITLEEKDLPRVNAQEEFISLARSKYAKIDTIKKVDSSLKNMNKNPNAFNFDDNDSVDTLQPRAQQQNRENQAPRDHSIAQQKKKLKAETRSMYKYSEKNENNSLPAQIGLTSEDTEVSTSAKLEESQDLEALFENEMLPHLKSLYHFAYRLTNDEDQSKDLVQDTYLKAYRFLSSYEKGSNAKAWLFRILKNSFINNYRKTSKEPNKVDYEEAENFLNTSKSSYSDSIDLRDKIFGCLIGDEVSKALNALPVDFRTVIILCDIEEFTYEEISKIVDIPIGTVRSRLHRARKMLREKLASYALSLGYNID